LPLFLPLFARPVCAMSSTKAVTRSKKADILSGEKVEKKWQKSGKKWQKSGKK